MKMEKECINELAEIGVGEDSGWMRKTASFFPALGSRNYRLYFSGQLVSLIGTWLQTVALGWLVFDLTQSAFVLGLIAAFSSLPMLLFSLLGGFLVDHFSTRKIVITTQALHMASAIILGFLTVFELINIWHIAALAFMTGVVHALDVPARQSFAVEIVDKKTDLNSAIALNSGIFNAARVIGPSIAGFLIASIGTGGAFLINGLSYIAVIAALFSMRLKEIELPRIEHHPFQAIKDGIAYAANHQSIRLMLIATAIVSTFGWSFTTIMPLIAQRVFHSGASGFGYLSAASGAGALFGALLVSLLQKKTNPVAIMIGGNILFIIGIVSFTFTVNFPLAMFFLFLAGCGLLILFSTVNSTIQHAVAHNYRGRVMSLYALMFGGLAPLGNFQIGFFSEHFGPEFGIRLGAAISFFFVPLIYFNRHKIKSLNLD